MHLTAEVLDSMVTTIKQKSLTHKASWSFYCSSQMAFLKTNFNGQERKKECIAVLVQLKFMK